MTKNIMFVALAALLTVGCKGGSEVGNRNVTVRGTTYHLPDNQIVAATNSSSQIVFVRLAPPGANFHLVIDSFHPYLKNKLGPEVPTISTLNDNMFGRFAKIQSENGALVICSDGPEPYFNCGIEVLDGDVRWSVLFDRQQLPLADEIRKRATSLIQRYRSA